MAMGLKFAFKCHFQILQNTTKYLSFEYLLRSLVNLIHLLENEKRPFIMLCGIYFTILRIYYECLGKSSSWD